MPDDDVPDDNVPGDTSDDPTRRFDPSQDTGGYPADPNAPTAATPAPGDPPVWRIAQRYRVDGRVGSGGMAEVFRAHDDLLGRQVALKVFRSVVSTPDTAAGLERQRAELHALARLNHPYLITLYDGSLDAGDGPAFLVMELIDGPSLAARIEQGPVPDDEVRLVGAQVAEALAYVHSMDMVHRDVKPANILLGASGMSDAPVRARLSDFGIVRLLGTDRLTSVDSTLGTASYLAPEQARGSAVGPPADVYALGLTLLEALTGRRAFDGGTPLETVVARLDHDPDIPPNLPQPWPGLLRAMTARNPAERPTANQVARTLRARPEGTTQFLGAAAAADAGTAVIGRPVPPVVPPPVLPPEYPVADEHPLTEQRPRRTGLWVGIALALILVALAAALLIATTGDDSGSGGSTTTTTPSTAATPTRSSSKSGTDSGPATVTESAPGTHKRKKHSSSREKQPTQSAPPSTPTTPKTSTSTEQSQPPSQPDTSSSSKTKQAKADPSGPATDVRAARRRSPPPSADGR